MWSWQRAQPIVRPRNTRAGRVELFVHNVHLLFDRVILREHLWAQREEAGRHDQLVATSGFGFRQQVSGELLLQESIERLVGIERRDHVVAIAPGFGIGEIVIHAVAVGVPGDVQPVSAPPLAVARRGQQPFNHASEGIGRLVAHERVDFLGTRWQPEQVERRPSYQGPPVGRDRRLQPHLFELRQNEPVDGRAGPAPVADGRQRRGFQRLEGPERAGVASSHLAPDAAVGVFGAAGAVTAVGHGSTILTHAASTSISPGWSFDFGGIAASDESWRTARINRLASGSPATIAGPESPPRRSDSSESRRRPAFRFPASGP